MESDSHAVLVFSINKPTATFDFVDMSLGSFLEIKKGTPLIIIADTLRVDPVMIIEKKSKKSAIATCTKMGDIYESHLRDSFKKRGVDIPIYRWSDLMTLESYQGLYRSCWEIAKNDQNTMKRIEDLALSHLKKRFPDKIWKADAINASIDFLLQETPLFCKETKIDGKQINHVCYPTISESDLVETLQDICKKARFLEDLKEVEYTQIMIKDLSGTLKLKTK